jgi:gliding motility-associated-like protein
MLIPNTFTPNDDGPNDSFDPVAILQDNKINITPAQAGITIVNRWGETVYHPSGYKAWTGKSDNGTTLPVSTYYYILSLKTNREINVKGPINLLR